MTQTHPKIKSNLPPKWTFSFVFPLPFNAYSDVFYNYYAFGWFIASIWFRSSLWYTRTASIDHHFICVQIIGIALSLLIAFKQLFGSRLI